MKRSSQSTTERLVAMLRQRHDAGLKKYGVTVDRTDLKPDEWIQHAIEELLDGAAYLMRLRDEMAVTKIGYDNLARWIDRELKKKVVDGKRVTSQNKRLASANERLKARLEKYRK